MLATLAAVAALSGRPLNILVFSKTAAFRHDSIPVARQSLYQEFQALGWTASFTEDAAWFSPARLKAFDCVVFLMTTGDVLDDGQQAAFEGYVKSGGGYAGVHAASDTEYDWPWYGRLVGAYFKNHPAIQEARVIVEDAKNPATRQLPNPWVRTDEWYNYRSNPRGHVHVLARLDESSYKGGEMAGDHPVVWCHEFGGGRSFYTGMGHTKESYKDPVFMRTLVQGIEWAARRGR